MIKVLKPGLATSVQDLGREGYYHWAFRPPVRSTSTPSAPPISWSATHPARRGLNARCWDRNWSSSATRWLRSVART